MIFHDIIKLSSRNEDDKNKLKGEMLFDNLQR